MRNVEQRDDMLLFNGVIYTDAILLYVSVPYSLTLNTITVGLLLFSPPVNCDIAQSNFCTT